VRSGGSSPLQTTVVKSIFTFERGHSDALLELIDGSFALSRGRALPLGATQERGGINFAVFSEHATGVTLVLFGPGIQDPLAEFPLDPRFNRTGHIWHAFLSGIDPGIQYGYRVARDSGPEILYQRFNPDVVLLDPYARGIVRETLLDTRPRSEQVTRRSVIVDTSFDWAHEHPLDYPLADSIIYELHVRAFTQHPSSMVAAPGTFAGLAEKIPYLQDLGITAVELMPIVEFDEADNPRTNPFDQSKLINFWGYHPLCFFAPHLLYGVEQSPEGTLRELKEMVAAFHAAGIEVILDVVFNHTGEGGPGGQTTSFRGIDEPVYYLVDPDTGHYRDYSGCGNTLNCNHPVVRDLVLDCLHYWVTEVHIDGFRFDLASILGRGPNGEVLANPPLIERIAADPVLAKTKLIAEAWDAAGLYQVGSFPEGKRWAEWNGRFRDDIRRFLIGERGTVSALATRLGGSSDLYQSAGRSPYHSINFVTCHDGFTLADVVSYNEKHNHANGENNCDGTSDNCSWNCGAEGPTDCAEINLLRQRQMKNAITLLLCSHGVPMLLFGDEIARSQGGNNNFYCHDNEQSWLDWDGVEKEKDQLRFFRELIRFRREHPALRRDSFVSGSEASTIRMEWHGTHLGEPDWGADSHALALHLVELEHESAVDHIYLMMNAFWEPLQFEVPKIPGWHWTRVIDTSALAPWDIAAPGWEQKLLSQDCYLLQPRSTVLLLGKPGEGF
jgi:isoamylase